jgi:predicted nucleotidyltransferase
MSAAQLEDAAAVLGPLLDDVVFVGGATIHLWITDPVAPPVRATDDVDVICEVATLAEYNRLGDRLRAQGLYEASDEAVICRWRNRDPELIIDVMPTDESILGFANPWYGEAIATAASVTLDSGAVIRAVTPALMLATKLAAWHGRGHGDLLRSRDVHDVLVLIDGRVELMDKLRTESARLRAYVRRGLIDLRDHPYFAYALDSATVGYGLVGQDRASTLRERVDELVEQLEA